MDMLPKPKREPEPLVVENLEESKEETKEEVKEEVKEKFVEEKTYAREHPEEELNQYSSEDDEAFAERVRMRMLANVRKKAMRKKLRGAAQQVITSNRFKLPKLAAPSTSSSSGGSAASVLSGNSGAKPGPHSASSISDKDSGGRSSEEDYHTSRKKLPKGFTAAKLRKARQKVSIIRYMALHEEDEQGKLKKM